MHIIFIRNYKRKAVAFCLLSLFWVIMLFLSQYIFSNNLIFKVTINKYMTFSYPLSFEVSNVFVSESMQEDTVKVNYSFKKSLAQSFSNFESIEGKFSFKYPSSFILAQKQFGGSDILYHIDFQSQPRKVHGFIQVWNLPYSLKDFLDKSKQTMQLNLKYFNSQPVTVNGMNGYLWDYSVLGSDNKYYKGEEVFLQKGDKMYRLSYFIPENLWSKSESDIFWNMVNSLKIY